MDINSYLFSICFEKPRNGGRGFMEASVLRVSRLITRMKVYLAFDIIQKQLGHSMGGLSQRL